MGKVGALLLLVIVIIGLATYLSPVVACSPKCSTPPPKAHYPPKTPGHGHGAPPINGAPPTNGSGRCPIDALKLGACVDLLGGLVHVGIGDGVVNKCCPLIQGIAEVDAALWLCTTIRAKLLNLNIILPLALQLLAQCGMTPPPGFTCPPLR